MFDSVDDASSEVEQLSLEKAASHLLEECRMVLPGVQALFGFQFVAVFSNTFGALVPPNEQLLHLAALVCVALAAALVMAPAALHRQTQPRTVSQRFLDVSSRYLMWSMFPLALGTTADTYIVAHVIGHSIAIASTAAAIVLAVFMIFWLIVPWRLGRQRRV